MSSPHTQEPYSTSEPCVERGPNGGRHRSLETKVQAEGMGEGWQRRTLAFDLGLLHDLALFYPQPSSSARKTGTGPALWPKNQPPASQEGWGRSYRDA